MAHRILQIVLYAGIPPETWAELWITPVFKDGDRYEVDRYRPITLMVVLAKAVEAVIQRRLQEKVALKDSWHEKRSRELALFILVVQAMEK